MERLDISDGRYNNLFIEVGREIFKHTGQLFEAGGKHAFKPLGSCVLIQIETNYFICSASHVLKITDENRAIYINTAQGIVPLYGKIVKSSLDNDTTIDIGYILLDYKLVKILKATFNFLQINKIETNTVLRDTNQFVTSGFPESNILEDERHLRPYGSFFQHKLASKKVYDYYKLDPDINYIVEHAGKGTNIFSNEKHSIESEPYGMSGCGLWFLHFYESGTENKLNVEYFLIGIMTEFKKYKYHVLIGNNINLLIDVIIREENITF